MVLFFLLSETCRATLDSLPIDRSDQDLLDGDEKPRDKSGREGLFNEILLSISKKKACGCFLNNF